MLPICHLLDLDPLCVCLIGGGHKEAVTARPQRVNQGQSARDAALP